MKPMKRPKVKLSLIPNNSIRRRTFKKRKSGIMKKLDELTTLCDVKACAVVYSPYESPVVWPSTEGVEEVVSKFKALSVTEQFRNMKDHETYLRERITIEQEQVKKLCNENRESQLRQFMFDCIEGKIKMSEHLYDARDLQDLSSHIHHCINQLNSRIKFLTENGESSSFPQLHASVAGADPPAVPVEDAYHPVVADTTTVTTPIGFYDYFQYNNMNMNLNQHEPVHHHVPTGFNDHIQHEINSNQSISLDPNQYPYQQESFMNLLMEHPQQMGYVGEYAQIPSIDGSHYNYHRLPTIDLATTGYMPSITTTTTTAGVYAPDINNL